MASVIVVLLVMLSSYFAMFHVIMVPVIAQDGGEDWNELYPNLISANVDGFVLGSGAVVDGVNGYFDLTSLGMPSIRAELSGPNTYDMIDYGEELAQIQYPNGTWTQKVVFSRDIKLVFELLIKTEALQNYFQISRSDKTGLLINTAHLIGTVYMQDAVVPFEMRNYEYGSDFENHALSEAVGNLLLRFRINPSYTHVPAEVLNGTSGVYTFDPLFKYWIGITNVKASNVTVLNGTSGQHDIIVPDYESSAVGENGALSEYMIEEFGDLYGVYNGYTKDVEVVNGGSLETSTAGAPLERETNTGVNVTDLAFYDYRLGDTLLDVKSKFFVRASPIIKDYLVTHHWIRGDYQLSYNFLTQAWDVINQMAMSVKSETCSVGVTSTNIYRKQLVEVTLSVKSYYDYTPYVPDEGFLGDPNEIVGDRALAVFTSGASEGHVAAPGIVSDIQAIFIMIAIIAVIIVVVGIVLYVLYKVVKSRIKKVVPI